jgi:hypothetical protein
MNPKSTSPIQSNRRILPLILCIVVFGVLMGIREDLPYRWQRIFAAAAAGGIIAVSINNYRKPDKQA